MGVTEELEELRQQGLTSKNAGDLKDAEGLSTPEASENAIKAELERTRLANYGKDASDYLKAASPLKKKGSSTNPFDDDKSDDEEVQSQDAGSSKNAKDISNLIQITNDFSVVGDLTESAVAVKDDDKDDEGLNSRMDCLFGAVPQICPIDSVESATSSARDALDEHVFQRVDGATASIRSALDEHIVPSVDKVRRQSMETVDDFHKRSLETMVSARQQSAQAFDSASSETQRLLGEVQSTSQKGFEAFQQQSQALLENSKKTMDGVSANTMALVDETVKPGFTGLWSALTVTYAPWYSGTAEGWRALVGDAWYLVLVEATLRAFGRVVFCNNPVTGIFIWIGILCASPLAAFCSLLGVVTVNVTVLYLDMGLDTIRSGQYARNAVLVGAALVDSFGFDFPPDGNLQSAVPVFLFWSIALAPSTLLLESVWTQKVSLSIPSLLFPFNIVLLMALFCSKVWNVAMDTQIVFQSPLDRISIESNDADFWIHGAVLNGLARIFFVNGSWWTGSLVLVGVLFCSRIVAASLVAGSFVATVVLGYLVFEENHWYLESGYAGANPALCAAGIFFFLVPSWRLTGLALFGIVSTLIVQGVVDVVLGILGTPASTSLGFCLTLFPLLSVGFSIMFGNREDYFIRTVPESELSTPEDYLKRINIIVENGEQPTDSRSDGEIDIEKGAITEASTEKEDVPTNEDTPLLT